MKPEIHARLTITGEFDPAEVTRRLAVKPRYTRRKGESWNPRNPASLAKTNIWSSAWSRGEPLKGESYLENLIDDFWNKRAVLRELVEEFGIELEVSVAIYIYDENNVCVTPSMHLGPTLIQRIADLGAEIDLDLYVIEADDDGETDAQPD